MIEVTALNGLKEGLILGVPFLKSTKATITWMNAKHGMLEFPPPEKPRQEESPFISAQELATLAKDNKIRCACVVQPLTGETEQDLSKTYDVYCAAGLEPADWFPEVVRGDEPDRQTKGG